MKNYDRIDNTQMELRQNLFNAFQTDDKEAQEGAFLAFAEDLQTRIADEAKAAMDGQMVTHTDNQILVDRGIRQALTSKEMKYFENVVERGGFDGVEELFPTTIIETVFENLQNEHPLLSLIDMRSTDGVAKLIVADPTKAKAFWGPICEDIRQMIIEGFKVVDFSSSRLSGFVAICKGLLELGPEWLARYIIEIMYEIMEMELEVGVIAGTGQNQPIGMTKKLSGAVDGVYPDKDVVAVTEFTPAVMGGLRAALASAKTDRGQISLVINPLTYWSKVFPALAYQTNDGGWVTDNLPTGENIVLSHAVPEDKAILGNLKNYLLGVAGDVRIDRYEQTLAIEDMELFIAKFYGWGTPKNMNAFFILDLSGVDGATVPALETEAEPVPGA